MGVCLIQVHVCFRAHGCANIFVFTYVPLCVSVYVYAHICLQVCKYVCTHLSVYVSIHSVGVVGGCIRDNTKACQRLHAYLSLPLSCFFSIEEERGRNNHTIREKSLALVLVCP